MEFLVGLKDINTLDESQHAMWKKVKYFCPNVFN
jgi:hypothetical protein